MRKIFLGIVLVLAVGMPASASADVWVNGYYKSNGTYVNGHYRSDPDGIKTNNWSYPGNTNPYTGVTAGGSSNSYLNSTYKPAYNLPAFTPTYTPSYTIPSYTTSYPAGFSGGTNYSKNPKYIKLSKQYDKCIDAGTKSCADILSDMVDVMLQNYEIPKKKVKIIKISEAALAYAQDDDCDSSLLKKADQKTCSTYVKYKDDASYQFKTISSNSKYYQTCGEYIYSVFTLDKKDGEFVCKDGVASLE